MGLDMDRTAECAWFSAPVLLPLDHTLVSAREFEALARALEVGPATAGPRPASARVRRMAEMVAGRDYLTSEGRAWVEDTLARVPACESEAAAARPSTERGRDRRMWTWRPDLAAFFGRTTLCLRAWEPPPGAGWDRVRAVLLEAAERHEPWLHHPAVEALSWTSDRAFKGALQLALHAAAHREDLTGERLAACATPLWTADGPILVEGDLVLGEAGGDGGAAAAPRPALDVWGDLSAAPVAYGWARDHSADPGKLQRELREYLVAVDLLRRLTPDIHDWLCAATAAATPLTGEPGDPIRSSTPPDQPGMVRIDLHGGVVSIAECLVHETAHRLLMIEEQRGPLVSPAAAGALYWSPLRKDPRPLRGILLAWHALIHMAGLFRRLAEELGEMRADLTAEAAKFEASAAASLVPLEAAGEALTPRGRAFVERYL